MPLQAEGCDLIRGGLEAAGIEAAVEIGGDSEAGLGFGGAGEVEDLPVGVQFGVNPKIETRS